MREKPAQPSQPAQGSDQRMEQHQQHPDDPGEMLVAMFEKGLPLSSAAFGREEQRYVPMRDGISLATQIFLPAGAGPWPVILARSPYPAMAILLNALGKVWTRQGYVFVAQACRGTSGSQRVWIPWENERTDGLDTLAWLREQPWSSGKVGMWGLSYLSGVQWLMADRMPPEVKALVLAVNGTERYRQLYMNGVFRSDAFTSRAIANAGVKTTQEPGALYQQALHIRPHISMDIELLGQELPWYQEWIRNVSPESAYWTQGIWHMLQQIPPHVHTPVLMIAGWYDHNLDGMIRAYEQFPEQTKAESRFVIGPWIHTLESGGDLEYPNSNVLGMFQIKQATEWFDHQLKGLPYPYYKGGVEAYIIGEERWEIWERGNVFTQSQRWYLNPSENASSLSGHVTRESSAVQETITYTYDPTDPVLTRGGECLLAWVNGPTYQGAVPSSVKQEEPGSRADIVTFLSSSLQEDVALKGHIKAHLCVSSDAEDTTFTVKLMEVLPTGNAYNIRDGITSLAYRNGATSPQAYGPGEPVDIEIELWPVAWTIKKGSRIRVDISSSNFPAYYAHSNIRGPWAEQSQVQVAQQTLFLGGAQSYMEFPVSQAPSSHGTSLEQREV